MKTIVYLYLPGGAHFFRAVMPRSGQTVQDYATTAGALAIPASTLLPLNGVASDGNLYGLHPGFPRMQSLFNGRQAAIICNHGPLVEPITLAEYLTKAKRVPPQLFSHDDQAQEVKGVPKADGTGWAGRWADVLPAAKLAWNISLAGNNDLQAGKTGAAYVISPAGALELRALTAGAGQHRGAATQALIDAAANDANLMVREIGKIHQSSASKRSILSEALNTAGGLTTKFSSKPGDSGLASQLQTVARAIKANRTIGEPMQKYYVQMGGWDTHSNERDTLAYNFPILDANIGSFYDAMVELGAQNDVVLIVQTDFGRGLTPNNSGSDHGWGNHTFAVGPVNAGYHGIMPSLSRTGPDMLPGGQMIPTTSIEQVIAPLLAWQGAQNIDRLLPNLQNFNGSLEFIK